MTTKEIETRVLEALIKVNDFKRRNLARLMIAGGSAKRDWRELHLHDDLEMNSLDRVEMMLEMIPWTGDVWMTWEVEVWQRVIDVINAAKEKTDRALPVLYQAEPSVMCLDTGVNSKSVKVLDLA